MNVETTARPRVLIADDDLSFARSFQEALAAAGTAAALVRTAAEALSVAERNSDLNLAFVDSQIAATGGISLMERLHRMSPALPVIIMSASGTPDAAVEAIKRGAEDYIAKPFQFSTLVQKVARLQELLEYRPGVREPEPRTGTVQNPEYFVHGSHLMRQVLNRAKTASETEASILLVGQAGVGKDMLVRVIHAASPRASGPFFRIDCRSFQHDLPGRDPFKPDLSPSAVSEAALQRMLKATAGGTLFLSEVGELAQDVQDKLVDILGLTRIPNPDSGAPVRPGPRVLASSSRSLDELREKCLRKDLYEWVADVVLEVPPLRSRLGDVLPLVEYFLGRVGKRYNRQFVLSWSCLDLLLSYSFPGNVRELESILERVAANLLQTPRKITERELRPFLIEREVASQRASAAEQPLDLGHVEQRTIERALQHSRGNRTKAAALLGIDRTTLYSKLRRLSGGKTAIAIRAKSGSGTKPKRNFDLEMCVKPGQHPS